jgi:hypothetical protein
MKVTQKEYHSFNRSLALLFFCGLLLLNHSLLAQHKKEPLKGGLAIGINAAQADGDGLAGYNKPGLFFGGSLLRGFHEKYSAEIQINFSQKGARSSQQEFEKSGRRIIIRYNYVEFPFVFHYHFSEMGEIGAGIAANYFVSGAIDPGDNLGFQKLKSADMKKIDFSSLVMIEYKLTNHLSLGGRFNYSLVPANKLLNSQNFGQYLAGYRPGLYNNVFTVFVAFRNLLSK